MPFKHPKNQRMVVPNKTKQIVNEIENGKKERKKRKEKKRKEKKEKRNHPQNTFLNFQFLI